MLRRPGMAESDPDANKPLIAAGCGSDEFMAQRCVEPRFC